MAGKDVPPVQNVLLASAEGEGEEVKTCLKCGIEKADEDFWGRYCMPCRKVRAKEYYNQNRAVIRNKAHLHYQANHESIRESQREYTRQNAERHRERSKEYYRSNLEKVKEYRRENKDHINEMNNEYVKKHRDRVNKYKRSLVITPKERLNKNMRTGISRSMKRGQKAGHSWKSLVGYTVDELRGHLEKQFTGKMNWENCGSYWHIDHIIPKSAFNYSSPNHPDFRRCWGLKNLRPLEAILNLKKGAKISHAFQPSLLLENCMECKKALPKEAP